MTLQAIDISGGQVSGVDDLSAAPSSIVNWEVDESGINRPRAGLATHSVSGLPSTAVRGLTYWKDHVIAMTSDRYIWAIPDGTPAHVQAASTSATSTQVEGAASFVTFALGDLYVYVAGGGRIQRWAPSLAASELLSSSPRCTHVASLNQYLIANDVSGSNPSTVWWSDIGEGAWSTWPAVNNMNADARPDPVRAIYENTAELFIFGSETLQVHALGSDPTFPFELVTTTNVGIGAPYSACRMESAFAFLDNRRRIVLSDGRSVEPISQAIQKDLRSFDTISDCSIFREERGQHSQLVVRFPTEARTFVYGLEGKKWRERDYYSSPFHADFPVTAHVYWPPQNYQLFGSSLSGGGLLRLSEDSRQDIGGALVCELTTGWQDFGSAERKQSNEIRIAMRRGTAAEGDTPGALEIRRQCDDGPWSEWQQVSVGVPSDYGQMKRVFQRRIFTRCRYGIRYSNTENMSLVGIWDDITPLNDEAEEAA